MLQNFTVHGLTEKLHNHVPEFNETEAVSNFTKRFIEYVCYHYSAHALEASKIASTFL